MTSWNSLAMSEEENKHEIVGNQLNRYGLYDLQELNHQEVSV